MKPFEIVAHRGDTSRAPENTIAAFEAAIEAGADAIELDVRLTKDQVPVVFHNVYLDDVTTLSGSVFSHTLEQLRDAELIDPDGRPVANCGISTLDEVVATLAGRIGLEIEIKGPEPESAAIAASILLGYRSYWEQMQVTSFEPALLLEFQRGCPGPATGLLVAYAEPWAKADVIAHRAAHRGRLAGARNVHFYSSLLSAEAVALVRSRGMDVHSGGVNDEAALEQAFQLRIPRICTDRLGLALRFREAPAS